MLGFNRTLICHAARLSGKVCVWAVSGEQQRINADIWFSDWKRGGVLVEEVSTDPDMKGTPAYQNQMLVHSWCTIACKWELPMQMTTL